MKADELADAVMKELASYSEDTAEKTKEVIKEVAGDVKKDISGNAPVGATGKYAKSWRSKKTDESRDLVAYTVYATKDGYPLAHLLEYGHAKRNGGRTRAQPHIKPAEEKGSEALIKKLEKEL